VFDFRTALRRSVGREGLRAVMQPGMRQSTTIQPS
jgi:hypothetical protein